MPGPPYEQETPDQAFALLARVSQEGNHVLRKVAETLVHSGVLGD